MATTVQNILDEVVQDVRSLLTTSGDDAILIDIVNRAHKLIIRQRDWNWMLSTPQKFITERGQTEYWIGATGSVSAGQVNTALNLTDVKNVKPGSVILRTTRQSLWLTEEPTISYSWQERDSSYKESIPAQYRNDIDSPNLISIYPAPDAGSDYEMLPPTPHSTTASGASLSARTYFIRTTFVDKNGGESAPSNTARQFIEASKKITVKAPQAAITPGSAGIAYDRWNVYASTTEGSETKQGSGNIATSSDWTEDDTGLTTTGASVPTTSEIEPLRGYVVEFRYYKTITDLTAVSGAAGTLQVPDRYKDIVIAASTMLTFQYLKMPQDAEYWNGVLEAGLRQMNREQSPWPGGNRFIGPDPTTMTRSRIVRSW